MSNQIEINNKIVKYLSEISNISDPIINELIKETLKLGNVSQMQISPEQGKFLEIIVKCKNHVIPSKIPVIL